MLNSFSFIVSNPYFSFLWHVFPFLKRGKDFYEVIPTGGESYVRQEANTLSTSSNALRRGRRAIPYIPSSSFCFSGCFDAHLRGSRCSQKRFVARTSVSALKHTVSGALSIWNNVVKKKNHFQISSSLPSQRRGEDVKMVFGKG